MTDGSFDGGEASTVTTHEAVERLQAEKIAIHERMLRALAETENTLSRAERSVADARKYAIAEFARELLTVADNLERAVTVVVSKPGDCDASLIEGVLATQRLLTSAFERFNIQKISALGTQFDPAFHEALTQAEDSEHQPGTIVQVFEDGYTINGRLLRPARVIIAKRRAPQSSWHH
jgi:molecular chaperone GrpE